MWRKLRIAILLTVLAVVASTAWLTERRLTSWEQPLRVAIIPLNGDGSEVSERYIAQLDERTFNPVEIYFALQAENYQVGLTEPVQVQLVRQSPGPPPVLPSDRGALSSIWWSLRMRWWASRVDMPWPEPDIKMFVLYYDPNVFNRLDHSVALAKGGIGLVNAYASRRLSPRNKVIIAHELLHTVGASDKYDPATTLPIHPQGYAEPTKNPLYPQRFAELMGGRVPLSSTSAEIPAKLGRTIIGSATASEIGWQE